MRSSPSGRCEVIALRPAVRSVTTTVHGAGYGLDVSEALTALVTGFREGLEAAAPGRTRDLRGAQPARGTLETALQECQDGLGPAGTPGAAAAPLSRRFVGPARRKTVFVAMPFSVEFEDVYEFGIYGTVRRHAGISARSVDETAVPAASWT